MTKASRGPQLQRLERQQHHDERDAGVAPSSVRWVSQGAANVEHQQAQQPPFARQRPASRAPAAAPQQQAGGHGRCTTGAGSPPAASPRRSRPAGTACRGRRVAGAFRRADRQFSAWGQRLGQRRWWASPQAGIDLHTRQAQAVVQPQPVGLQHPGAHRREACLRCPATPGVQRSSHSSLALGLLGVAADQFVDLAMAGLFPHHQLERVAAAVGAHAVNSPVVVLLGRGRAAAAGSPAAGRWPGFRAPGRPAGWRPAATRSRRGRCPAGKRVSAVSGGRLQARRWGGRHRTVLVPWAGTSVQASGPVLSSTASPQCRTVRRLFTGAVAKVALAP